MNSTEPYSDTYFRQSFAPWGSPPTPVIPQWYIISNWTVSLPRELCNASPNAEMRYIGDLDRFWEHRSEPLSSQERRAVMRLVRTQGLPPPNQVVIPAGADTERLLQWPLTVRTRNCMRQAFWHPLRKILEEPVLRILEEPLTVRQLMMVQNFGIVSLVDLMCVAEAAIAHESAKQMSGLMPTTSSTSPLSVPLKESTARWDSAIALLEELLKAAQEFRGATTLADALSSNLAELAHVTGVEEQSDRILISDLTQGPNLAEEAIRTLRDFWDRQSPAARSVIEQRILAHKPATLRAIASESSVTRERIRQIQKKVEHTLNASNGTGPKIAVIANLMRPGLDAIATESELERQIKTVFPSPTIDRVDQANSNDQPETSQVTDPVVVLAQSLLKKELGYVCRDGICLNKTALAVVQDLKQSARSIRDNEGIVDELALQAHLTDDSWVQDWQLLIDACGLHRLNGQLSLRDSVKARIKAAILSIGCPATKEEIAELCGLTLERVTSYLSSISGVVRADKKRWGLKEWIDDEYEGIPAEIIQRIEEDGGATRLERLLEELPRMFGVAASSVEAYAKSARFQINDSYVSLADPSSIVLRPLEDVVHGRTADGLPYWKFKVESRYFNGYSVVGLPHEIAKALGCEPDGRLRVPVLSPEGCKPVSVSWPLSSLTGATLGYLSDPLRLLNAHHGETMHLVLEGCGSVSLRRLVGFPEETATRFQKSDGSPDRATELLERMKRRRRGI